MKKLLLIGFLAFAPLAGCALFQSAVVSTTTAGAAQASTVKAAGELYILTAKGATAYLDSGHASKEAERKIVVVENQVYDGLIKARQADANGDSAAVAAALSIFNSNRGALVALIPGMN